jgi:hypothetical protein
MTASAMLLEELEPLMLQVARMWASHPRRMHIDTQWNQLETEAQPSGSEFYLSLLRGIRNSAADVRQ